MADAEGAHAGGGRVARGSWRHDFLRRHYRDRAVAERYDHDRFGGGEREARNQRELAAIDRAIARTSAFGAPARDVLDLPCGTGRLFRLLGGGGFRVVGADISLAMMEHARRRGVSELVQCEAEQLPFRTRSFDCVVSLRFMLHLGPAARRQILEEMARVTRRWVVLDVRHKYTTRYLTRLLRRRLAMLTVVGHRFSRAMLEHELSDAGLRLVEVFPSRRFLKWFSDKWFVLGELATDGGGPGGETLASASIRTR